MNSEQLAEQNFYHSVKVTTKFVRLSVVGLINLGKFICDRKNTIKAGIVSEEDLTKLGMELTSFKDEDGLSYDLDDEKVFKAFNKTLKNYGVHASISKNNLGTYDFYFASKKLVNVDLALKAFLKEHQTLEAEKAGHIPTQEQIVEFFRNILARKDTAKEKGKTKSQEQKR